MQVAKVAKVNIEVKAVEAVKVHPVRPGAIYNVFATGDDLEKYR